MSIIRSMSFFILQLLLLVVGDSSFSDPVETSNVQPSHIESTFVSCIRTVLEILQQK